MYIGSDELRRGFDNISRGKEITQTHSLSAYLKRTYAYMVYIANFYTPYTLRTCIHPYPTHQLLQTYKPTHNQSYKRTYTLHLPYPYIPTLLPQLLHPTLQACPIIKHKLQEQAVRWCGCVLPVMKYYLLRNLLAKLLHLIWLFFWDPPAEGRGIEFSRKSAILADCTTIIVPFVNPFNGNFCELGRARFAQNKMEFPSQDVSKIYSILLSAKFEPFLNLFRGRAWWMCGMNLRVFMTWLVL